jgi:acyl-CoA thioesterase
MIFPPPGPLAELLGVRAESQGDGQARFAVDLRQDHLNPYGVVHGGVVYSLIDTAMGAAVVSRLAPGERCATLEVKLNYLAPATEGRLTADARVVERGGRIAVLEARVVRADGRVVAIATGTYYIQGR